MSIIIGNIGSDAGYWVLDENGLHHVGGWGPEAMVEVQHALQIMRSAVQLKTPGLTESVVASVREFVEKQIAENVRVEGPVVIVMG